MSDTDPAAEIIRVTIEDGDGSGPPTLRPSAPDAKSDHERELERAQAERAQALQELAQARADRALTAASKAKSEASAAERDYQIAFESGDSQAAAAALSKMNEAALNKRAAEEAAHAWSARAQQPADPVEAYCQGRTEPTQRWLRDHADYVTDPRKNAKLNAAHFDAVAGGLEPDSQEYFSHIERHIGLRGDGGSVRRVDAKYGLPSSLNRNDPNTHVLDNGRAVFLTEGEKQRATDGTICWNYGPRKGEPVGLEEYARRKRIMVGQGQYRRLDE